MNNSKPKRDLKSWMKKHRFTPTILKEELPINSPSTVFEWLKNKRVPRKNVRDAFTKLILRIEGKENAFPAEDFFVIEKTV